MRHPRGARELYAFLAFLLLILGALVPPFLPVARGGAPERGVAVASTVEGQVNGSVQWNGRNVSGANGPEGAFSLPYGGRAVLRYAWASIGRPAGNSSASLVTISDARLQLMYFGEPLATRDVVEAEATPSSNGTFFMNWTPGDLPYLAVGNYEMVASLLAPDGVVWWSESFYVRLTAMDEVLSALPLLLILIAIYEVYAIATVRPARPAPRPRNGARPPSPATEPIPPSGPSSSADPVPPAPPEDR